MTGTFFRAFLGLLLALAFAGCSTGSNAIPSTDGSDWTVTPTPPPTRPVRVEIPALQVDSPVIDLALQPNGKMEVPPDARETGWYERSPIPGQIGAALLAAHVNWKGEDGPFARLHELKQGDEVTVHGAEGAQVRFIVDRVETHPKDAFPHEAVYGDRAEPELVLVTCGGELDPAENSYESNVIAFAKLAT
jgi:LPXTG-site transpeptidase (sortase) family protein